MSKPRRHCIRPKECGGEWCARDEPRGCVYEYREDHYKPEHRYKGDWPPPRRWIAADGTVVYRTYSDYCD